MYLARQDREVDALERLLTPEGLREIAQLDDRHA